MSAPDPLPERWRCDPHGARAWSGWRTAAALAACVAGAAVAIGALDRHARTPGEVAVAPATWPGAAGLSRDPSRITVVVFAHPLCPCTRASLDELRSLVVSAAVRPAVRVVFVPPAGAGERAAAESIARAREIPGAEIVVAGGAAEAARFGARTSGLTLAYAPDGSLAFSGGLTALRGHVGRGAGGDALAALLSGRTPAMRTCDVLGCPLFDEPAATVATGETP